MTQYSVQILPSPASATGSIATGINDNGDVVGSIFVESAGILPVWWSPSPTQPMTYNMGQPPAIPGESSPTGSFQAIDNYGNAIGLQLPSIFNIDTESFGANTLPFTDAAAINNNYSVVGGNVVFNFQDGQPVGTIPLIPGSTQLPTGLGMNDLGDVVGIADTIGFFYESNPSGPGTIYPLLYPGEEDQLRLVDINRTRLAVGTEPTDGAFFIQLGNPGALPYPTYIPIGNQEYTSEAAAINDDSLIVGSVQTGGPSSYAFVYQYGQQGLAIDLNSLLQPPLGQGWQLQEALDINNKGQIVGYAVAPNGWSAAYIATPVSPLMGQILRELLFLIENLIHQTYHVELADRLPLNAVQKARLADARKQMTRR